MAIIFANAGLIDLRALHVFGWSAKVNENPIGFFGSGSRYAIAGLLRLKHSVTLFRGLDKYVFGTVKTTARGVKEFDMVTMTGPDGVVVEMPFTLDLGKTWPDWAFFRELHSNALDENGTTTRANSYTSTPDTTAFVIIGDDIEHAYNLRDTIFLPTTPLWSTTKMDIHRGGSQFVYYRGVRVFKLERPTIYTYNLKELVYGITEDRTLANYLDIDLAISHAIACLAEEEFLRAVLVAPEGTYEHSLSTWISDSPADTFLTVFRALREEGYVLNLTALANATYLRKHKILPMPNAIEMTHLQQMQLDKAVAFCKRAGWDVDRYPIIVVPHMHGGLIALAHENQIVLTVRAFESGVGELCSTLFEEWSHLAHKMMDCSREFQTHIMRQLVLAKQEALNEVL